MSTLQEFKYGLIADFLQTFAYDKNTDKESKKYLALKKAVNFPGDISDVVAYSMDQAPFGKNKNSFRGYALFTKDTFYGVDINEKPIQCKLTNISKVTSIKGQRKTFFSALISEMFANGYSEIVCTGGKTFSVTPAIGEHLEGFAFINELTKTDPTPFRRFMISRTPCFWGEIAAGSLDDHETDTINRIFPNGAAGFIRFYCKLKRLELDGAYYEIVIKDNKIKSDQHPDALYTEYEWGIGVNQYTSHPQVLKIYQENLKRKLALHYNLDQLHFEANVKTSLGTRLKDTVEVAQYSLDKMQEITEKRMVDAVREYERKQRGE